MFISFLFNNLYRHNLYNWYTYMLNACVEFGYPIITNEFNLQQDITKEYCACNDEYRRLHELKNISPEKQIKAEQYYVPAEFFSRLENESGSKTEMTLRLLTNRCEELEIYLENALHQIQMKHTNISFDGFFVFGEPYESIRHLATRYGCSVIAIELAAIRVDSGYTQSLFYANSEGRLYGSDESECRYKKFLAEEPQVPMLSRRELIALFCKESSLPLIPLLDARPKNEIVVCGGGDRLFPPIFSVKAITDDDMLRTCEALYSKDKIIWRERPYSGEQLEILRQDPDPTPSILGSKRIASIGSNVMMEAMLWNRTCISPCNALSIAFQCEKDFTSVDVVDVLFLNYLFFGYLVPGYLNLLDPDYWMWRNTKPSEQEIYHKNLLFCLEKAGIDERILYLEEEERFKKIMEARGCDAVQIAQAMENVPDETLDYSALISNILVIWNERDLKAKERFCLNRSYNGLITSRFEIINAVNISELRFRPLGNMNGFARVESVEVDGATIAENNLTPPPEGLYNYRPEYVIRLSGINREKVVLTFYWKHKRIDIEQFHELLNINEKLIEYERGTIKKQLHGAIAERDAVILQRDGAIAERDAVILQRNNAIAERDAVILQRDDAIAERDAVILQRDGAVAERDAVIIQRDGAIMERDGVINQRDAVIKQRDGAITERDELINQRDEITAQCYAAIRERETVIMERDAAMLQCDEAIAQRDTAIVERDAVIVERDKAIQAILQYENSLFWRATKPVRKLIDKIRHENK